MNVTHERSYRHAFGMLVLGVLFTGPAVAQPADGAEVAGIWVGSDRHDGRPSSVRLRVGDAPGPGQELAVAYGAPRHCRLLARRSDMLHEALVYESIESSGGVHCDALHPGTLTLLPGNGQVLTLRVEAAGRRSEVVMWRPGSPSTAGMPRLPPGTWTGAVPQREEATVGVSLTIGAVEPGDRDGVLRYGGARRCSVPLAYEGVAGESHYFSVVLSNGLGGYCDRLAGRFLRVQIDGQRLTYRFDPPDEDCRTDCVLAPAPRR